MQEGTQKDIRSVVSSYNRDEIEKATEEQAKELKIPYYDVRKSEIATDILSLINKEEAQRGVIPIMLKNKSLSLGVTDVREDKIQDIISYLKNSFNINKVLISWASVKDILPRYDGLIKRNLEEKEDYEITATEGILTFSELESQINSAPLQNILSFIVSSAISSNASDIHLEPQKEGARIRFRVDGVLHVVGTMGEERFKYILSQIELSGGMKLNVDEAQEGRIEIKMAKKNISVRIETMPTLYGDDISLRIFNTESTLLNLSDLGLYDYNLKLINNSLARPQGMILVVGPTGAGKTSTIYAVLNVLNKPEVKIITLEDPIEYALTGITQSQIHEDESFNIRLKAVLREDPDIVMVGEIRDAETADVALHAALTGHVMISTFHAYNAATAVTLLREIATNGTLLASAINLIIAQRLVRRICEKCKIEKKLTEKEYQYAADLFDEIPDEIKGERKLSFFEGKGCEECKGIGYKGRIAIHEMLQMNVEFQKVVAREDITVSEIQEAAKKSGMVTMEQDGLLKAIDGITSLSEVMKAIKE